MPETPHLLMIPMAVDVAATYFMALTGAIKGIERRFDIVGVLILSLAAGLGGSILRDGLFLQDGPPVVVRSSWYLLAVILSAVTGALLGRRLRTSDRGYLVLDALALSAYAILGLEKALALGLGSLPAAMVGTVGGCGGGMLRDLLAREDPLIFKPGQFYAMAVILGCGLFILLDGLLGMRAAAYLSMASIFGIRCISIYCDVRTSPVHDEGVFHLLRRRKDD